MYAAWRPDRLYGAMAVPHQWSPHRDRVYGYRLRNLCWYSLGGKKMTATLELTASPACDDLIKYFEDGPGFLAGKCSHLTAYLCPAGVWTIGWGCTGQGIREGVTITQPMADALYLEKRLGVESDLHAMTTGMALTQGMWDALVSLSFNLKGGPHALPMLAPKLWNYLKAGRRELAAAEFSDINKANVAGRMVELPGLTLRRKAEAQLFMS
jgi:lysozyme